MHWQRGFLEAQLGIGRDSSSLPQSAAKHVLVAAPETAAAVQIVSASQSTLPQAQVDGLGAEPSVVAQTDGRHLFWDRSQYMPSALQSTLLPHAQADGLGAEPSVMAQVENCLHLFWER